MRTSAWFTLRVVRLVALGVIAAAPGAAQHNEADAVRERTRTYRASHEIEILNELRELLAIPNVAQDSVAIRQNAAHIIAMLERRGIATRLLEMPETPPAVYGERAVPGARHTVMLYAHYDGQPADPTQWASPPWTPVLRDGPLEEGGRRIPWEAVRAPVPGEWRVYARSASDDKAPLVAVLRALDALEAAQIPLSVNIKFFLEGEEEAGSNHLRATLERYRDLLGADVWLFLDGPVHQTRRQQIVYGARGVMGLGLTVYGPERTLHSGHYGNWAPNPATMLARLLATMRDEDGRILIDDFADDVLAPTEADRVALAALPRVEDDLVRALGLGRTEGRRGVLESTMLPGLNVDGLYAGDVGAAARNAIPTEAVAAIDFRLVPNQTPEHVRELVERHVERQGYFIVRDAPDRSTRLAHGRIAQLTWSTGYPGFRTSLELPVSRAVALVADEALGAPTLRVPMLGGSLPLYDFVEVTGAPVIIVPIVNHDNNQHAANENLRIRNLWDGIDLFAGLLARLGSDWR